MLAGHKRAREEEITRLTALAHVIHYTGGTAESLWAASGRLRGRCGAGCRAGSQEDVAAGACVAGCACAGARAGVAATVITAIS